jgi:hypothetical protein
MMQVGLCFCSFITSLFSITPNQSRPLILFVYINYAS